MCSFASVIKFSVPLTLSKHRWLVFKPTGSTVKTVKIYNLDLFWSSRTQPWRMPTQCKGYLPQKIIDS